MKVMLFPVIIILITHLQNIISLKLYQNELLKYSTEIYNYLYLK